MLVFQIIHDKLHTGAGIFFSESDARHYANLSEIGVESLNEVQDFIFEGVFYISSFTADQSLGSVPFAATVNDGNLLVEQCDGSYGAFDLFPPSEAEDESSPELVEFNKVQAEFAQSCAKSILNDESCQPLDVTIGGKPLRLICHFFE